MTEANKGVAAIVAACLIWGGVTLYYHALAHVPPLEMMAHRTLWTAVCFAGLLAVQGRLGEVAALWRGPERASVMLSSAFIAVNWFLFIWAVGGGHAVEASLGYYIYPLVSSVIGVVVFRERPVVLQVVAVGLALVAVLVLTVGLGVAPWVALTLASSFAGYAAVKKGLRVGAVVSVTMEVLLLCPFAVAVLIWTEWHGGGWFLRDGLHTAVLPLAGVISGGPLILFSYGAARVRLVTSGLVQYLNPTLQFVSAVVVMGEPVTLWHGVALALIWLALALYTAAGFWADRMGPSDATSGSTVK